MLMLAAALVVATPLVIAARLSPDPSGLGTHQQLGLPPCTTRLLWGVRCPGCGMTTAWAHFVRGELAASLRANVAGTLLAGSAGIALAVLGLHGVLGTLPRSACGVAAVWGMILIFAIAMAQWAWRLI